MPPALALAVAGTGLARVGIPGADVWAGSRPGCAHLPLGAEPLLWARGRSRRLGGGPVPPPPAFLESGPGPVWEALARHCFALAPRSLGDGSFVPCGGLGRRLYPTGRPWGLAVADLWAWSQAIRAVGCLRKQGAV